MKEGKSKLIEAVKALREEIHGKVREQLADDTREPIERLRRQMGFPLLRCNDWPNNSEVERQKNRARPRAGENVGGEQ